MIATAYTGKSSALVLAYELINDPFSDPDLRKVSYRLDGGASGHKFHFGSVAMS